MKKNLFIILLTILLILTLTYLYNQKEIILNKKYQTEKNYIEYPFFNNKEIDNYINNYLNNYIDNDYLFIDYDYQKQK